MFCLHPCAHYQECWMYHNLQALSHPWKQLPKSNPEISVFSSIIFVTLSCTTDTWKTPNLSCNQAMHHVDEIQAEASFHATAIPTSRIKLVTLASEFQFSHIRSSSENHNFPLLRREQVAKCIDKPTKLAYSQNFKKTLESFDCKRPHFFLLDL